MSVLNFPTSPSDGDSYTFGTTQYLYSSSKSRWSIPTMDFGSVGQDILPDADSSRSLGSNTKKWKALHLSSNTLFLGDSGSISAGAGGGIEMGSLKIGSGEGAVELTASADGKLKTQGTNSAGVTASTADEAGAAKSVADMPALVALTGMTTGETCLVTSLNRIFMYTGTGWFKIADMTNESPSAITGVDATITLATDGTASVVTAVSTDPEGFPLTWSYAVTTGSLGSTATVAQVDNVFTITPSSDAANAGSFSITFSVTDGATGAVNAVSAFTLAFQMDGTLSYYVPAIDQSLGGKFGRGVACNDTYSFFLGGQDNSIDHLTGIQTDQIVAHSNSDGAYVKSFSTGAGGRVGSDNELACNETYVASKRHSNNVYLWNISTGALAHQFPAPSENGNDISYWGGGGGSRGAICLSPSYIAIGSRSYDTAHTNSGAMYVYNVSDFSLRYKALPTPSQTYNYSTYNHGNMTDTHLIMGNSQNGTTSQADYVYVFNNSDGSLLHTISQPSSHPKTSNQKRFGNAVAINNNNYFAISNPYYDTGAVHVYNTTTGALRYTISDTNSYVDWGETISMSDNLIAISGYNNYGGNNLTIHNLSDGTMYQNIGNHTPTGGSFANQVTPTTFARGMAMNRSGTAMAVSDRTQSNTLGTVTGSGVGFIYK